jgi:outer membrane protein OmpA-like peptidoglycan-associated protein
MKSSMYLLTLLFCFIFLSLNTNAQFDLEKTIKKKVEKKAEKEVEKGVDKGLEEAEDALKGKDEKGDKTSTSDSREDTAPNERLKAWSRYDFVAGDKIIFEDNLSGEQNGEFPSKWDLVSGNAENALLGDENVITFVQNRTEITPLMKSESYLPEVFTIEFDVYFYNKYNEAYMLALTKLQRIDIRTNKVSMGKFVGEPGASSKETGWHHIALSFNKRALKVYFDQTRALNIPNVKTKPTAFTISALSHGARSGDPALIKNIRIAEGGVKLYDRLLTEGKIITRGILFDFGKWTIKPESMGVINEIAKLMKEHPDVNFSIEGHTDGDGEEAFNQKLSEQRAAAVRTELVSLGINESRLQTKGWGESIPVDSSASPEGKANNRRVEFVKI